MDIIGGIASTTHLDYHAQCMTKGALDQFAKQIRAKYIPLLINHDFDQQIGVNLSARVVQLEDGEYALLVVNGIFENETEAATLELINLKHGSISQKEIRQVQDFFRKNPKKLARLKNEYDRMR